MRRRSSILTTREVFTACWKMIMPGPGQGPTRKLRTRKPPTGKRGGEHAEGTEGAGNIFHANLAFCHSRCPTPSWWRVRKSWGVTCFGVSSGDHLSGRGQGEPSPKHYPSAHAMFRQNTERLLQGLTSALSWLRDSDGPCCNISENAQEKLADLEILCSCLHTENSFRLFAQLCLFRKLFI